MTAPLTLKIGGAAGANAEGLRLIAEAADETCVVVHGGGSELGEWSRRLGLEPRFHDGLRVTDPATLEVAVAVLGGLVNARLVASLGAAGRGAVGLTGADGGLLSVRPAPAALGRVGEVDAVDPSVLDALLDAGFTPVVAPIGSDESGDLFNLNADAVAGAVAAARGGRLLLCTDVEGVRRDGRVLDAVGASAAEAMLADGSAAAGMRPKLRAALDAARAGCEVRIVDGSSTLALAAALSGASVGTEVRA